MKKNLLVAVVLLTILAGCSSDSTSPTGPTGPTERPLVETTVDANGATLAYEGFLLTVPAGALPAGTNLKLYGLESGAAFGGGEAAPVFRVDGLPAGLPSGLSMQLAHTSTTGGDSLYAFIGGVSYVPSLQSAVMTWQVADCRDSLGWALFDLPEAEVVPDRKSASRPISVTIIRGVAELLTDDGRFKVYWSPAMAATARIVELKNYIEEAMVLFDAKEFEQEGFAGWPVQAVVKPMLSYGYWAPSPVRLGGHLAFSSNHINDPVEMRLTAGHELLHFCQYFYDPRTVWARGSLAGPLIWIDEATAVYIEDYFAPDAEYCSAAREGRELTLLDGLLVPAAGRSMGEHGYGLSSLIRYLAQREGDAFILETYRSIKNGQHAVAALQENTETDIAFEWREILEQLIKGEIYSDVTPQVLDAGTKSTLMTINSLADSAGTHLFRYPDLSGKTYHVLFPGHSFASNQRLVFWCDAQEYGLSVFGWNHPEPIELLQRAYGAVILGNLPALQDQYSSILVLVSNQRMAGPNYLGPTEITLRGRLRVIDSGAHYTHGRIRIRYEARWSSGSHILYQDMSFPEVEGAFSGTDFSGVWDYVDSGGTRNWGHVEASFDPADMRVLSWSASNNATGEDGSSRTFAASGSALPQVTTTSTTLTASIEGVATCSAIGNLTARYVNSEGVTTNELESYTCNTGSWVRVLLYDRSAR